jgi:non-heme chloroperoxidase
MRLPARLLALLIAVLVAAPAAARDLYFTASDGAHLHYTLTGPPNRPVLVFVPGWTMPGWIFAPQAAAFSQNYQVVLFDPRGQGSSQITPDGYTAGRRGADIGDLLSHLPGRVVLVGWSLGVLDSLAYLHAAGPSRLAGLVLIDNSVGENPPPTPPSHRGVPGPVLSHAASMRAFVASMFHTRQSAAYLKQLTEASLITPPEDASALLRYDEPRSFWKDTLLATSIPTLYIVRPHLAAQAQNLLADRPNTDIAIFPKAGHALFVDEPARFNMLLAGFLHAAIKQPPTHQQTGASP